MKIKNWRDAANYCEKVFGIQVEYGEDNFFICPVCGEPIYKEDWEDHDDWHCCPICEEYFNV